VQPEKASSPPGAAANLDLDGRVRVGELKLARLRFASADLRVRARDGKVDIDTLSEQFYQGRVAGRVGLDQSRRGPTVTLSQRAEGLETGSMLKDLVGDDWLTGRSDISADLVATGRDTRALKRSLSGTVALHVGPGVVKGFNAERLIKEAGAQLQGKPAPVGLPNQTDFDDLRANAQIRDGVLTSRNLAASSDYLRVTGKGSADLGRERLDFRFEPVLVKPPPGQGIDELVGIPIPVRLTGTFVRPRWNVDVASALRAVARRELSKENGGLFKKLEERTGIKGLERGLRGLFGH
jgi:AsmA protein